MVDPDNCFKALSEIYTSFGQFCKMRGQVTEADTRAKIIDRILKEALGWPEDAFARETPLHEGYLDYLLTFSSRNLLLIEAKREGLPFDVPITLKKRRRYKLSGIIKTNPNIRDAIYQAQRYTAEIPVRYAVVTNGYAWLIFRAIREDIAWHEGSLIVFQSAGEIKDHFTEFWNILSYSAILGGSLDKEFSSEISEPRLLIRPIDQLKFPDAPLLRNRFHIFLHPFVKGVFGDIDEIAHFEKFKKCYVHTRSLRIVDQELKLVIEDSIPQFGKLNGAIDTKPGPIDSGPLGEEIKNAVSTQEGSVFLLLGGIGSGKTTYLNRFSGFIEKEFLRKNAMWFYINFKFPPPEDKLEEYVKQDILNQLRLSEENKILEKRESLLLAYEDLIRPLKASILDAEKLSPVEYEKRLNKYLERWIGDSNEYVNRMLRIVSLRGKTNIVCIDNVDQLSPDFQVKIFHLAQRLSKEIKAVVIVALREESYYSASIQRAFTAYNNRIFHIASPPFGGLIARRLKYCRDLLKLSQEEIVIRLGSNLKFDRSEISKFLDIVQYSIFSRNKNIVRFIEALAFGNMREALEMFISFLYSGVTNVDKMLKIYDREGQYFVPFHEFAKSIILGDRTFYKDSASKILNLFECGQERNSSHFTSLRMLAFLLQHVNEFSPEGRGFVNLERIYGAFIDIFDNEPEVNRTFYHLLRRQLIQLNTRSLDSMKNATHARVSSAGWYYFKYLVRSFPYLDLVFQDTPINDQSIGNRLRQLITEVDEISDIQEYMIERMDFRFERVETFLSYLSREEKNERKKFSLDLHTGPLAQEFILDISLQYQNEKEWIQKRIAEKAYKRTDDAMILDQNVPEFIEN